MPTFSANRSTMSKVAVVTGASGGIGRAAAAQLAAKGCTVYDLSRSDKPQKGVKHISCDVSDEASVRSAIDAVASESGRIDILVCCAGIGISGAVEFTEPEDSYRQLNVNLFGADRAVRAALPYMREAKSGRIVLISSVAAVAPIPFQTWYSASKAAINSYAMALMNEIRPFGIGVAVVMPGDICTGFTSARKKSAVGDKEYNGRIERSVSRMENDERNGLSPDFAAKVIVKAALSKRPKPLRSTGFVYGLLSVLLKVLPTRLSQWVLYCMYAS